MCNLWKTYRKNPGSVKKELSISEIQSFLSDREFFKNLSFVYLSGGEPFLRKDLPDIIRSIHKCKPTCTVYVATNGFLTDHIVKTTKEILSIHSRFQIGVSLDGMNEVHDRMRGIANAFTRASQTLLTLKERYPKLHIQATMTATPINFKSIPDVYSFCKKYKFHPRIGLATTAAYFNNPDTSLSYSEEDINYLKRCFDLMREDTIREHGKIRSLSELFWLDGSMKFLINPRIRLIPCYAGFVSFFIDPYGIVFPCYNFLREMGSIRKQNIREIWYSQQSQEIRRRILLKECPNCWIVHEAASSVSCDYFRKFKYILK
jgi:MoaA/NifB/PqqE/SkfB family radical SAM enzyme